MAEAQPFQTMGKTDGRFYPRRKIKNRSGRFPPRFKDANLTPDGSELRCRAFGGKRRSAAEFGIGGVLKC
ncbi:hypothetical protein [Ensifer sp. LC163]|uniref:hypothetical protein n=1 Tax=Ensifer sp. LC163 TaxID=1120652 RepID=UPI001111B5B9|nr:hypothetical protein [Ensifer sp. LC163]